MILSSSAIARVGRWVSVGVASPLQLDESLV
jgi:hypothetical protein